LAYWTLAGIGWASVIVTEAGAGGATGSLFWKKKASETAMHTRITAPATIRSFWFFKALLLSLLE
jgi:hypothetical protein